jgi:hypothetical protein
MKLVREIMKESEDDKRSDLTPPDKDGWRQEFVATKGPYKIAINDREDASAASVWLGDQQVGRLTTLGKSKSPDGWLGVHIAEVDKGHRDNGLGTEMYRALASHLSEDYEGLYAQPTSGSRFNGTEIPAIYKKLGGYFDEEGNGYLPRIE